MKFWDATIDNNALPGCTVICSKWLLLSAHLLLWECSLVFYNISPQRFHAAGPISIVVWLLILSNRVYANFILGGLLRLGWAAHERCGWFNAAIFSGRRHWHACQPCLRHCFFVFFCFLGILVLLLLGHSPMVDKLHSLGTLETSTYCHDIGPSKLDITWIQAADLALPTTPAFWAHPSITWTYGVIESCVLFEQIIVLRVAILLGQ